MTSSKDIRSDCHMLTQKIASYLIACDETWGGNDVTDADDLPRYLVKLYADIVRGIQRLWDTLQALQDDGTISDDECDHLGDMIGDLEQRLGGSKLIPALAELSEALTQCTADANVRTLHEKTRARQVETLAAKRDRQRQDAASEDSSLCGKLPSIIIKESQTTKNAAIDAGVPNRTLLASQDAGASRQSDAEDASFTPLPSIRSCQSLVGSPCLVGTPSTTDGPHLSRINYNFKPPNMDTFKNFHDAKTSEHHADDNRDLKPRIASLSPSSKSRQTQKWRSNLGYPFGSSFPQLPPITKKRRLTGGKQEPL